MAKKSTDPKVVMMKNTTTIFKWILIVWILVMNGILTAMDFKYGWLIFISNIMMFTMGAGTPLFKFVSVEVGGFMGLIAAVVLLLVDSKLAPSLGAIPALLIPLAVILFFLIIVHDKVPWLLNNTGFAYMTVVTTVGNLPMFVDDMKTHFIGFVIGSLIFNGVSLLLLKLAQNMAISQYKKKNPVPTSENS